MRILGNIAGSISKFAEGLRAFSTAGKIGKVTYEEVVIGKEDDGTPITKTVVKIDKSDVVNVVDIAANLSLSLSTFVKSLTTSTEDINKRHLKKLSKALNAKGGLMGPIASFAEILRSFSDMSDEGKIPAINQQTGEPILENGKPKFIDIKNTATKVATSFSAFITEFTKALNSPTMSALQNSDIKKISKLSEALGDLINVQEGMDKMATSVGVLATNIGALSTNLKALDTTNLAKVTIAAGEYQKRYGQYGIAGTVASGTTSTTTATIKPTSQYSEEEWRKIAILISDQLNATFKNKPFQFKFASGETLMGVIQV
jgi:hypothetical protein